VSVAFARGGAGRTTAAPAGAAGIPLWIERVAWLLDDAIPVPFTRFRFGLDALLGLIPGAGDIVPALFGLVIVLAAARLRVPHVVIARMGIGLTLDALLGLVPVVGDASDFFLKANRRNLELLRRHAHGAAPPTAADRWVVAGVVAGVLLVPLAAAALLVTAVAWMVRHPW